MTFEGQHEQSIAEFEKAIALNPNFTDWRFGTTLVRAGDPERAIQVLETHMRYDPLYVPAVPLALGFARYMLKEYSEALPPLREFASRAPNVSQVHIFLAANLAQLGQLDEARAEAAEVLRIDPKYTIAGTQGDWRSSSAPRTPSICSTACARRGCRRDSFATTVNPAPSDETRTTSAISGTGCAQE